VQVAGDALHVPAAKLNSRQGAGPRKARRARARGIQRGLRARHPKSPAAHDLRLPP
jgi:hypothetical protein